MYSEREDSNRYGGRTQQQTRRRHNETHMNTDPALLHSHSRTPYRQFTQSLYYPERDDARLGESGPYRSSSEYHYTERGDGLGDSYRSDQTGYPMRNNSERTEFTQGSGHTMTNSGRSPFLSNHGRSSNHSQSYTTIGPCTNSETRATSGGGTCNNTGIPTISNMHTSVRHYDDSSSRATISGTTTVADGGQGRCCPYQIAFQVQNQGKQISSSKRIVHFRFGFANTTSMLHGKTGTDCRGEEHDIVITWSITGSKSTIVMDEREVLYTAPGKRPNDSRRADLLEASWRMSDHVYELKCYAYKPACGSSEKRNPRWKQYSLIIDGRSYFELPQIFDLGLKGLTTTVQCLPPSVIQSCEPSSISGLTDSMRSNQTVPSIEMKHSIQARIDEQRRILASRKHADSVDCRGGSGSSRTVHSASTNTYDTGVYSAAPSELDEVKNRMQAPPPPLTSAPAVKTASQNEEIQRFVCGTSIVPNDFGGACNGIRDRCYSTSQHTRVARSDARSDVSNSSSYVSEASFVPEKLFPRKPLLGANVVTKGVNKWGYF